MDKTVKKVREQIEKNQFVSSGDAAAVIRKAIRLLSKKHGVKALSVRRDRGTAAGWIVIRGVNGSSSRLTEQEEEVLRELDLVYPTNGNVKSIISPDDHEGVVKRSLEVLYCKGLVNKYQ